ncbi:hypothetical protein HIN86_15515 [Acinetobacter baumannii]|uniref:hypothetical protein n=1 Tax=Acinetobacter baumannii TaxID=470 RepID=UPI00145A3FB6|nr:hypothetical protein [Acinetobacter baumannii]QJF31696.1 hypothetical protein HIN87_10475 [Acinetobacter baumannii]QJF36544.1 hypothetical protein HIN86_15515 [Acinetobacter baumannii]
MKPEQFIREQGLPEVNRILEEAPKHSKFVIPCLDGEMYFSQREDDGKWFKWSNGYSKWLEYFGKCNPLDLAYSLSDLKRLVESLNIIRVIGPIEYTRSVVTNAPVNAIGYDTMYEGYFGEETKHYYENLRTFTIDQIKDAVAAHESIYGGGDETN